MSQGDEEHLAKNIMENLDHIRDQIQKECVAASVSGEIVISENTKIQVTWDFDKRKKGEIQGDRGKLEWDQQKAED